MKKVCDENQEKETQTKIKKCYKLSQRSERGRPSLKQGLMDHFIMRDI